VICLHCPLHDNGSINRFPRQQVRAQHVTALLEEMFPVLSEPWLYTYRENRRLLLISRENESSKSVPSQPGHESLSTEAVKEIRTLGAATKQRAREDVASSEDLACCGKS
jgi:hypothetical protein